MSKIYGISGVILHGVQSFLSPRIDWNFRHLSSCDTKDHDETRGTSVSHDFSSSWANRRVTLLIKQLKKCLKFMAFRGLFCMECSPFYLPE